MARLYNGLLPVLLLLLFALMLMLPLSVCCCWLRYIDGATYPPVGDDESPRRGQKDHTQCFNDIPPSLSSLLLGLGNQI